MEVLFRDHSDFVRNEKKYSAREETEETRCTCFFNLGEFHLYIWLKLRCAATL